MKTIKLIFPIVLMFALISIQTKAQEKKRDSQVFFIVEDMPEYPGGESALREDISEMVKYPDDAKKENISGKVFVTFTVAKDGSVVDSKIARGVHPSLDKEAIRVIKELPKWKPGKQRGEAVNVQFTLPINFALNGGSKKESKLETTDGDPVFLIVEEMPEFPGGEEALRTYISKSVKYPEEAKKEGIQGKVFISFTVSTNGSVKQAKVERGVHPTLDKEAIRVVSDLPTWKPGKQRGQNVNVQYTVPVNFVL